MPFTFDLLRPFFRKPAGGGGGGGIVYKGYIFGTQSGVSASVDLTAALTSGTGGYVASGDCVILFGAGIDTADVSCSIDSPSGVTPLGELYSDDNRDTNTIAGLKIMGGTPDTSASMTLLSGSTRACEMVALVFSGVDGTSPLDDTSTYSNPNTATGINGNNADSPPIDPSTTGAVVVSLGAGTTADTATDGESVGSGYPSGYTLMWDYLHRVSPYDIQAGAAYIAWSGSGSEDPGAWTFHAGSGSSQSWAAYTLALRPA